jgi:hypothetical protein
MSTGTSCPHFDCALHNKNYLPAVPLELAPLFSFALLPRFLPLSDRTLRGFFVTWTLLPSGAITALMKDSNGADRAFLRLEFQVDSASARRIEDVAESESLRSGTKDDGVGSSVWFSPCGRLACVAPAIGTGWADSDVGETDIA